MSSNVENLQEEDVMLKKNKKSFSNFIKTVLVIIVLVLIGDFAILLMLNKLGQVNINNHISDIPVLNFFTNDLDTVDEKQVLINELTAEVEDLKEQLKNEEIESTTLDTDNGNLRKEIQTLKEKIAKMESSEEDRYKLADYYSKMKPKAAAEAMNQVEPDLAVQIFLKMQDEAVAAIMQNMLPEKVAEVSKTYEKLKK